MLKIKKVEAASGGGDMFEYLKDGQDSVQENNSGIDPSHASGGLMSYMSSGADSVSDLPEEDFEIWGDEKAWKKIGLDAERKTISVDEARLIGLGLKPNAEATHEMLHGKEKIPADMKLCGSKENPLDRSQGFAYTLSIDHSVSAFYACADAETKKKLDKIFEDAHSMVIAYWNRPGDEKMQTRSGAQGKEKHDTKLIGFKTRHFDNREGEPAGHYHGVIFNFGLRPDGTLGALDGHGLHQSAIAAGTIFQREIALGLGGLGIPVNIKSDMKNGVAAEINVQPEVLDLFSKRSQAVEKRCEELGDELGIEKGPKGWPSRLRERAVLETRKDKAEGGHDMASLQDRWTRELKEAGIDLAGVGKALKDPDYGTKKIDPLSIEKMDEIINAAMENERALWTKGKIQKIYLETDALCGHYDTDKSLARADEYLKSIIEIRNPENGMLRGFIHPNLLKKEQEILDYAKERQDIESHVVLKTDQNEAFVIFAKKKGFELADEQKVGVGAILGKGSVITIQGKAGTGKTTMLEAACLAIEINNKNPKNKKLRMLGCAISKSASGEMKKVGVETVASVTGMLGLIEHKNPKKRLKLTDGDILVIDEAGMLDTAKFHRLFKHCEAAGVKIVSLGDWDQMQAIGAGGMHKKLGAEIGYVELKNINRQKDQNDKIAIQALIGGDIDACMDHFEAKNGAYEKHKKTNVCYDRAADLFDQYSKKKKDLKEFLILSETKLSVRKINKKIQDRRVKRGDIVIGGEFSIQEPEDPNDKSKDTWKGKTKLGVGERIVFLKNQEIKAENGFLSKSKNAPEGINNGNSGEVVGIDGDNISVKLDVGGTITFDAKKYKEWSLAYAMTLMKSQGQTRDEVVFVATEKPPVFHALYVALTRHRHKVTVVTTDKVHSDFRKTAKNTRYNETGIEILEQAKEGALKKEADLKSLAKEKKAEAKQDRWDILEIIRDTKAAARKAFADAFSLATAKPKKETKEEKEDRIIRTLERSIDAWIANGMNKKEWLEKIDPQTGETALFAAARQGSEKVIRWLIGQGADALAENKHGENSWEVATTPDIIHLLMNAGSRQAHQNSVSSPVKGKGNIR